MGADENRQHWDALGRAYQRAWATASRRRISRHETDYIRSRLPEGKVRCLDLGCGTGRILEVLDTTLAVGSRLEAVDIAPAMLDACRLRPWRHTTRFALADVSKEAIPFAGTRWDCVTSIRVIKYNKNWQEIIEKVAGRLKPGGVFICTMPNRHSLNIFGRYAIPHYRTTASELVRLAGRLGLELVELRGFSRIPDLLYQLPGRLADSCLAAAEYLLGCLFGKRLFQREFFIVLRKPPLSHQGAKPAKRQLTDKGSPSKTGLRTPRPAPRSARAGKKQAGNTGRSLAGTQSKGRSALKKASGTKQGRPLR